MRSVRSVMQFVGFNTAIQSMAACLLIISSAHAQWGGGGDLNPGLEAPKDAVAEWQDRKVGLSIHWGPSSIGGAELGWSRHASIENDVYDNFYKEFDPHLFDADEWAALMERWGVRYVSPTAKHHDGFSLFFSDYSEYDMENAKRPVDIMGELARALIQKDIMLGAYYSIIDWYHPDWPDVYRPDWAPIERGGPGPLFEKKSDSPNLDRYYAYMQNQVLELIRKYDVDFIQFDGDWDTTYTHEAGSNFYKVFREEKPSLLMNSRIDVARQNQDLDLNDPRRFDGSIYAGDFQERERSTDNFLEPGSDNSEHINVGDWGAYPWQAWGFPRHQPVGIQ